MSDWGKGVINNIGWGQGANNDIGYGSIYADSNSGLTLLLKDNTAFIIEVKTDNAGTSNDNQFQFTGAEGDYDVVAKQGGVVIETFNDLSDEATITFANGVGTYILEVSAKEVNGFNRIQFTNGGDKLKITDIKQWGEVAWSSFKSAFFGCENMLVTATDVPNLSLVTSIRNMFRDTSANPYVENWNTGNIEDMSVVFFNNYNANPNVTNWNTTNLKDANFMFNNASSANPDTSNWNVANLESVIGMFFNSNLSVENLTLIYENWSQLNLQQNVTFSGGTTKYNASGQAGRDVLVNTYNWLITDGGQV